MKVTHVLYLSARDGTFAVSGAEHHVLTLLPLLVRSGITVELVVMAWAGGGGADDGRLQAVRDSGVDVHVINRNERRPTTLGRYASMAGAWYRLYRHLRTRRDRLVHLHLDLVFAPLIVRAAGCRRLVVSVHNDEPAYQTWRWRLWFRLLTVIVSRFIAITEHVRQHLLRAFPPSTSDDKVITVHYGFPTSPTDKDARTRLGVEADEFVVGFVGRLVEQKNVETLIRALAERPSYCGVIVGDGPRRASLEALAAELHAGNVRFLGHVPDAASLIGAFDVFCLPSVWEGLGVVLIEAMQQRVPILGSRRGAIPEVLENGEVGVLFEPNTPSLLEALDYAAQNRDALAVLAERAHASASERFTPDAMVSGTRKVYEAVGGRP